MLGKQEGLLMTVSWTLRYLAPSQFKQTGNRLSSSLIHEKLRAGLDIETQTRLYVAVEALTDEWVAEGKSAS